MKEASRVRVVLAALLVAACRQVTIAACVSTQDPDSRRTPPATSFSIWVHHDPAAKCPDLDGGGCESLNHWILALGGADRIRPGTELELALRKQVDGARGDPTRVVVESDPRAPFG